MNTRQEIDRRIAHLEQDLDALRAGLGSQWRAAKDDIASKSRWFPLVGVGVLLVTGIEVGRRRRNARVDATKVKARPVGALAAAAATALRVALSPQVRALWQRVRTASARPPDRVVS